ncbi:MAG: UDP-4-amino-4,6-dideoxy-N-acetyl-beta-L-altrosamine N-acetyltransferase [Sulfurospirillum sp.]|nr:UDP-4-amino-4,6-dideoxy-N-acetyl-beta-L-altrosamine N-acetyltransferase [Sulfurospirillum sp.]
MQKVLELTGYELNAELREKQANFTMDMCLEFIDNYDKYKTAKKQSTQETFYKKRDKQASELDIDKTIKEQFNLLRIVDNENYPAFFQLDGNRYILKIELEKWGGAELIDFTDMTLEEKKMVLEWRNDIGIKKWMYNTDDIKLQNHFDYIESLAGLHNKQYLLVKKDNNYIGVICFTKINYMDKVTEFGLYANPFKKMLGVGRILEELSIKYIFDILKLNRIKLEVFSNNLKVINLHKKYNFHEVMSKTINNKSVICMELDKCD